MRSVPARCWLLALISALLQLLPFPMAGPVPAWRRLICWFCLVPLLMALTARQRDGERLTSVQGGLIGYLCGAAWFCGNCYWIYQTMFLYGGLPGPVSLGILILFSLYLGLYFGLFGVCVVLVERWKGRSAALWTTPFLWVGVELARARITGFPWDLLGYTQVDNLGITRLAPWTGVMGLSLIVALGNVLWLWRPAVFAGAGRQVLGPVAAVLLAGAVVLAGLHQASAASASALATLVQDNLSVGAMAQGAHEGQADLLAALAQTTFRPGVSPATAALEERYAVQHLPPLRPELVLWPEAPTDFSSADPAFRASMGGVARAAQAPVIADAVATGDRPDRDGRYDEFVSASFFLPDGTYAGRYDKMHLVPFGEYTPYKQLFFFAGHLLDQLNFEPGTRRTLFSANGHRYGVFICYESIFGDEVRQFALRGAQVFVNLSDDGWYGDTSAPWEHLDMARMRAIENGRWLLRDTNTGLTASIDPQGRIVAEMPRHRRGAVVVPFDYRNDLTFYTRHGDWLGWLCAVVSVSVLLGGYLQRRYPYQSRAAAKVD